MGSMGESLSLGSIGRGRSSTQGVAFSDLLAQMSSDHRGDVDEFCVRVLSTKILLLGFCSV